jgi:SAM-dependent methyltransferase
LEVGCGCGRIASALTNTLGTAGSYNGFDIVPELIAWARKHITSEHRNFHFGLADIYNQFYNPSGLYQPSEYTFPYSDETFDVVFLTSVFTHMYIDDIAHYIAETARVLKSSGKCLATYFLLNSDSTNLLDRQGAWPNRIGKSRPTSYTIPEDSIAHDENDILGLYTHHGFTIQPPICYGSWCGRPDASGYQDIVVASKR